MARPAAPSAPGQAPPLVQRVLRPFNQFFSTESAGGIVLLVCTALALAWANSPWADSYFHLWEIPVTFGFLTKSLHHWINDGLMVVFFFLVGLEIKREMLVGELASVRRAALPIAAAVGGMVVPAAIYAAFNWNGEGARGWGIPMATDIAFALGVLALLGPRVPLALKVFLTALAIVDDIGAVLVIALFYTAGISVASLGAAAIVLLLLIAANRAGVRHAAVYAGLGFLLWLAVYNSGVHATVAGVLLAMTIPARTVIDEDEFLERANRAVAEFGGAMDPKARTVLSNRRQQEALDALERSVDEVQAPLMKMEHGLHTLVAFGIMPLFAFANAGVAIGTNLFAALSWSVVLGIVGGLVVGKALGITLASWLAVRSNIASAPGSMRWGQLHGVSWLGGIGFTMSLFVANLAFGQGPLLDSAKVGILAASVMAGIVGWLLLRGGTPTATKRLPSEPLPEDARPAAAGPAKVGLKLGDQRA